MAPASRLGLLALAVTLLAARSGDAREQPDAGVDHPAPDTDRSRDEAQKVMARALAAAGGAEAFAQLGDFALRGEERRAQNPDAPWSLEILWLGPEHWLEVLRRDSPRPLQVSYGWNGRDGWVMGFGQVQPDAGVRERLVAFEWTRIDRLAERARAGALVLLYWGPLTSGGRKWKVVEANTADGRERRYLFFDGDSGLLGEIRFEAGRIAGVGRELTIYRLGDYRRVGAIEWPFAFSEVRKNRAGETVLVERRIETVSFNSGLTPGRFARRAVE